MIGTVVLAACNDDDDDVQPTTLQKLQQVWLVDSTTARTVTAGSDVTIAQPGIASDYFDFRSDGKLYFRLGAAQPDTVDYSLVNDNKLVIDGDTAIIQTITTNKLVGSTTVFSSPTSYNVITNYLRR
jgi:hypothetical protein